MKKSNLFGDLICNDKVVEKLMDGLFDRMSTIRKDDDEENNDGEETEDFNINGFTSEEFSKIAHYGIEDFKDDNKFDEYCRALDGVLEKYENLPVSMQCVVDALFGTNIKEEFDGLKENAKKVNAYAHKCAGDCKKETKEDKVYNDVMDLATEYVLSVFTPKCESLGMSVSDDEKNNLITCYTDFGLWLLNKDE